MSESVDEQRSRNSKVSEPEQNTSHINTRFVTPSVCTLTGVILKEYSTKKRIKVDAAEAEMIVFIPFLSSSLKTWSLQYPQCTANRVIRVCLLVLANVASSRDEERATEVW